jgi:hypothetical protein
MTDDQIEKFTDDMVKQIDAIDSNAQRIGWYMRGGVTYNDIMMMSGKQVDSLNKIIDDNLETSKKSGMPFF